MANSRIIEVASLGIEMFSVKCKLYLCMIPCNLWSGWGMYCLFAFYRHCYFGRFMFYCTIYLIQSHLFRKLCKWCFDVFFKHMDSSAYRAHYVGFLGRWEKWCSPIGARVVDIGKKKWPEEVGANEDVGIMNTNIKVLLRYTIAGNAMLECS